MPRWKFESFEFLFRRVSYWNSDFLKVMSCKCMPLLFLSCDSFNMDLFYGELILGPYSGVSWLCPPLFPMNTLQWFHHLYDGEHALSTQTTAWPCHATSNSMTSQWGHLTNTIKINSYDHKQILKLLWWVWNYLCALYQHNFLCMCYVYESWIL